MKKLAKLGIALGLLVFCIMFIVTPVCDAIDVYIRSVVEDVVHKEVESSKDEIKEEIRDEVKGAIVESLKDEETKKHLTDITRKAVAKELEENGRAHFKRIFGQSSDSTASTE